MTIHSEKLCRDLSPLINVIRYVKRHTTIPVPTVHGYGTDISLTTHLSTTQSFIITDRIFGTAVTDEYLLTMTKEKRLWLFSQIGDVLAELQDLTFPTTGSLFPDEEDAMKHRIGPTILPNDVWLGNMDGVARPTPTFTTTWESIQYYLKSLCESYDIKDMFIRHYPQVKISEELYVIHAITSHVNDTAHTFWRQDMGFVLGKSLYNNFLHVDEDGNIKGISGWSSTTLLPRQLCLPSGWLLNAEMDKDAVKRNPIWKEFQEAITPDHPYYKPLKYSLENEQHLYFASMLRFPASAKYTYFARPFFETQDQRDFPAVVAEFFSNPVNEAALDRRVAEHKAYAENLIARKAVEVNEELAKTCEGNHQLHDLALLVHNMSRFLHRPQSFLLRSSQANSTVSRDGSVAGDFETNVSSSRDSETAVASRRSRDSM